MISTGIGFSLVHESGVIIRVSRSVAPSVLLKSSPRSPLVTLIGADADGSVYKHDERPVDYRISKTASGSIASYNLYLRVKVGDNDIYEGRPARFSTERESEGFPILLSPACRVLAGSLPAASAASTTSSMAGERMGRVFGPGVYLSGKDLKAMEFMEAEASMCHYCFYAADATKHPSCFSIRAKE